MPEFPIHTHGSIGPSCGIAELTDGKLTVWTTSSIRLSLTSAPPGLRAYGPVR